jgi:hypothetical protein
MNNHRVRRKPIKWERKYMPMIHLTRGQYSKYIKISNSGSRTSENT